MQVSLVQVTPRDYCVHLSRAVTSTEFFSSSFVLTEELSCYNLITLPFFFIEATDISIWHFVESSNANFLNLSIF